VNFEQSSYIAEQLNLSNNFFVGRLGSVESELLVRYSKHHFSADSIPPKSKLRLRKEAWVSAGIWPPTKSELLKFSRQYEKSLRNTTAMAVWENPNNLPSEREIIETYCLGKPKFSLSELDITSLAKYDNPVWLNELEGKKVLIVSSFGDLIKRQYEKLENLHSKRILPQFDLSVIVPPKSNGLETSFIRWSEKLRIFENDLDILIGQSRPYVALVAAGAYGMPVCNYLYQKGVSSIYVGGALQLYFGIWGERWRNIAEVRSLSTQNWIDPESKYRPKGAKWIENSAYW